MTKKESKKTGLRELKRSRNQLDVAKGVMVRRKKVLTILAINERIDALAERVKRLEFRTSPHYQAGYVSDEDE